MQLPETNEIEDLGKKKKNNNKKMNKKKKKRAKVESMMLDESIEIEFDALAINKSEDNNKTNSLYTGCDCEISLYLFEKVSGYCEILNLLLL
jgi:hypothetical protein